MKYSFKLLKPSPIVAGAFLVAAVAGGAVYAEQGSTPEKVEPIPLANIENTVQTPEPSPIPSPEATIVAAVVTPVSTTTPTPAPTKKPVVSTPEPTPTATPDPYVVKVGDRLGMTPKYTVVSIQWRKMNEEGTGGTSLNPEEILGQHPLIEGDYQARLLESDFPNIKKVLVHATPGLPVLSAVNAIKKESKPDPVNHGNSVITLTLEDGSFLIYATVTE